MKIWCGHVYIISTSTSEDVILEICYFSCSRFGNNVNWMKTGIKYLNYQSQKNKVLETSEKHLYEMLSIWLCKMNITIQLSETDQMNIVKHNEKVRNNTRDSVENHRLH